MAGGRRYPHVHNPPRAGGRTPNEADRWRVNEGGKAVVTTEWGPAVKAVPAYDPPYFPMPGDPWYNADTLHRARAAIVRGIVKTVPEPEATWRKCVLDRAFWECLEYAEPDKLAKYLDEIYREAMQCSGTEALHTARRLVRIKALSLTIPERDW